jgi:putative hydrolase of the HAD superfamily
MKKYTHLFFDLDRTLWDFEANTAEVLKEMYDKFGLKVYFGDFYTFSRAYHEINNDLWEKYRQGVITKDILRWTRFHKTLFQYNCDDMELAHKLGDIYVEQSPLKTKLYPNTIETLALLNDKYKQYILTNGFKEVQHIKVKQCNLEQYFERVFTSEEAGKMKPSKIFFNYVLSELQVKPENCLMIGDDVKADIEGARNCNIDQVFFNPQKIKTECTPNFEIYNLKELLDIL